MSARASVLKAPSESQVTVEEQPCAIEAAQRASEAFITSATNLAVSVVEIDGVSAGEGRPGQFGDRLQEIHLDFSRNSAV